MTKNNDFIVSGFSFEAADAGDEDEPQQVTVTLSGSSVTIDGTEEESGDISVVLASCTGVTPENSTGTIAINLSSSTTGSVSSSDLSIPASSLSDGSLTITATNSEGWTLGSETIESVSITGTYASRSTTFTVSKVTLTAKDGE